MSCAPCKNLIPPNVCEAARTLCSARSNWRALSSPARSMPYGAKDSTCRACAPKSTVSLASSSNVSSFAQITSRGFITDTSTAAVTFMSERFDTSTKPLSSACAMNASCWPSGEMLGACIAGSAANASTGGLCAAASGRDCEQYRTYETARLHSRLLGKRGRMLLGALRGAFTHAAGTQGVRQREVSFVASVLEHQIARVAIQR